MTQQNQQTAPQQNMPHTSQSAPQPTPQLSPQPSPLVSFATTAPEPTQKPNAWDSIIAQQQEQINALMAQNQALTGQITQMVQGGAQFTQQPQQPMQVQQVQQAQQPSPLAQFNPPSLSDDNDYSMGALGYEISRRER